MYKKNVYSGFYHILQRHICSYFIRSMHGNGEQRVTIPFQWNWSNEMKNAFLFEICGCIKVKRFWKMSTLQMENRPEQQQQQQKTNFDPNEWKKKQTSTILILLCDRGKTCKRHKQTKYTHHRNSYTKNEMSKYVGKSLWKIGVMRSWLWICVTLW